MKSYIDLDVWKNSRRLVKKIYLVTMAFPKEEIYGLTGQMRRSSVSIPSNIAEGHGRKHAKESLHFFYFGRGSLYELETQTFVSFDLEYINQEKLTELSNDITECKKMLNGLIRYYETLI
ncbi:MAG: four helix bundle protein [Bacteroidota bacterium]